MQRTISTSMCFYIHPTKRLLQLAPRHCSSTNDNEYQPTVEALSKLSVDLSKIRKMKGWVLHQSPAYVSETVSQLRKMGADGPVIARILELHPEAVLCRPEHLEAQKELWMSVCSSQKDLVGIIEKFPASFFTSPCHLDNQRANVEFFRNLGLNKRVVAKLMASAPTSFSRHVEQNGSVIQTLQRTYLELGGNEDNMKVWLQKLLSQNPYVLLKAPEGLQNNLRFLRKCGFTSGELLQLLAKLKGFVTEVNPEAMEHTLDYSKETLKCTKAELRQMALRCPALLYFSVPVLAERFRALFGAGASLQQVVETPSVLELTTHIVQYRVEKLRSLGYDIKSGSLEVLNGTKKDFEGSCGRLQLRRERPLFNPVAPLQADE